LIIDTAMMAISEQRLPEGRLPDYHCGISTPFYKNERPHFGTLLKLHGSLNWLHCRTCHRLEIGAVFETPTCLAIARRLSPPWRVRCKIKTKAAWEWLLPDAAFVFLVTLSVFAVKLFGRAAGRDTA
jgi:hypothetical protein